MVRDQAVVKKMMNRKTLFSLVGTASAVKRTRTLTRAMMTAISDELNQMIKSSLLGHRNLGMDALDVCGNAVFSSNNTASSYGLWPHAMASDISRAIAK